MDRGDLFNVVRIVFLVDLHVLFLSMTMLKPLFHSHPAAIRLQKYSSDPPHFPAAIAMISHGSPTDSRIRLENVGSAFKVSARDMARQPVNIPTLTPL